MKGLISSPLESWDLRLEATIRVITSWLLAHFLREMLSERHFLELSTTTAKRVIT